MTNAKIGMMAKSAVAASMIVLATQSEALAELQSYTITAETLGAATGTFSGANRLNSISDLGGTGYTRSYILSYFTAGASQNYRIGITSAPQDTYMILYSGVFDPALPLTNYLDYDDDTNSRTHLNSAGATVVGCDGDRNLCSQVTATLSSGDLITLVVTTYDAGVTTLTPITLYANGPGRFAQSIATPATEFSDKSDAILQTVTDDALRGLTSAMSANQAMVQDAKGRFVAGAGPDAPLDVNGSFEANPVSVSSMGTFFGQTTQGNGTRQVVSGSFDVQRDDTTGASTATFNGKIAWERSVSDTTLLGYFIGGDLARSNIAGSFTGDQDHLGVTAGGYAVHEMAKQLYLDGFVSVGAGRNNLTMDDGVLVLESDYTTRSATFGVSVSGVIGPQGYEIWPELALTVGRTWIDTVAFTGTAYDATDNTLSLDAGMVTLANLTFRPEFRVPLDGMAVAKSLRLITLAPRLICQQTTTTTTAQTCGGGAEIGLQTHSADGTTTASAQILSDWIDGQTRTSGQLSVEMRF